MSIQLQLRHDTAVNWSGVTPAQAEAVVDITNNRLLLGDGATPGGWPVGLETRTAVSDASYTALVTDRLIAYTSLTAARTVTLPAAASYPNGARLTIVDETGSCSPALSLTAARAGSDTIDSLTYAVLANAYASLTLESNGTSAWTILANSSPPATLTAAQGVNGALFKLAVLEQIVTGLSGANVTAGTQIPAGALVVGCASRVTTAITGATSFSVGYTGSTNAFGSGLGVAIGSSNEGLIGPNPFYSATNLILTASGSNFTAGAVRLALAYLTLGAPTS
jgi:hypothetical protein